MFFHIQPRSAFLSDRLLEVVNSFRVVRDNVVNLIERLKYYEKRHTREGSLFFYRIRKVNPKTLDTVERAARFIYLNKTCYNGIYRVNDSGLFNVPIGSYDHPGIVDAERLTTASAILREIVIKHLDYRTALDKVERGDFVYLDPPYSGRFTSYHQNGFGSDEQEELASEFKRLHRKGVLMLMSNGADDRIVQMYKEFKMVTLQSRVYLSGKLEGRRKVPELLVLNYDPKTAKLLDVAV